MGFWFFVRWLRVCWEVFKVLGWVGAYMRRVHIDLALEYMGRRIRRVDMGDQGFMRHDCVNTGGH